MIKICTKCLQKFPSTLEYFYKQVRMKDGLKNWCINCCKEYDRKQYYKNPEKYKEKAKKHRKTRIKYYKKYYRENKEKMRNIQLENDYGISLEEYNQMLEEQNQTCYICKRTNNNGRDLCVDHDHDTNKIRGLLCHNCNFGIGYFQDDIKLLERTIKYLQKIN